MAPIIPILHTKTVYRRVKRLIQTHLEMKSSARAAVCYQTHLRQLFDICSVTEEVLKHTLCPAFEEDYKFYIGMKLDPQVGTISQEQCSMRSKQHL